MIVFDGGKAEGLTWELLFEGATAILTVNVPLAEWPSPDAPVTLDERRAAYDTIRTLLPKLLPRMVIDARAVEIVAAKPNLPQVSRTE